MPVVSVCIPCRNHGRYLAQAIESVLTQKLQDFEVIVVDDDSQDETAEVVRRFKDSRIHYLRNESHMGQGASVNRALSIARGTFIGILHADDAYLPEALSEWVEWLHKHPEAGYVHSAGYYIDERGSVTGLCQPFPEAHVWSGLEAFRRHVFWNFVSTPSLALARRECYDRIGGYDASGDFYPCDLIVWLRMELAGYAVAYTPRPLAYYRRHDKSLTSLFVKNAWVGLEHVLAVQRVLNDREAQVLLTPRQRWELHRSLIRHFSAYELEEAWRSFRSGSWRGIWAHLRAMVHIASFEKGWLVMLGMALGQFVSERRRSLSRHWREIFQWFRR